MRARSLAVLLSFLISSLLAGGPARAEPWFGWNEGRAADTYADGDIDEEDVVGARLGLRHFAGSDLRARSWISLKGFYGLVGNGTREVGAIAVVGLALDKIAAGPSHPGLEPRSWAAEPSAPPAPARETGDAPLITPKLARACVAAAWRASGLGVDDAHIADMIARAHRSAVLPETRLRVMRVVDSSARTTTPATTGDPTYYDGARANLWLEARFTWRLDRLIYVDDEPTIERVRIERQDARARLSARVLDALFAWQRAALDARALPAGSREALEAELRVVEAEATLDVLTAGWFSAANLPPKPK